LMVPEMPPVAGGGVTPQLDELEEPDEPLLDPQHELELEELDTVPALEDEPLEVHEAVASSRFANDDKPILDAICGNTVTNRTKLAVPTTAIRALGCQRFTAHPISPASSSCAKPYPGVASQRSNRLLTAWRKTTARVNTCPLGLLLTTLEFEGLAHVRPTFWRTVFPRVTCGSSPSCL